MGVNKTLSCIVLGTFLAVTPTVAQTSTTRPSTQQTQTQSIDRKQLADILLNTNSTNDTIILRNKQYKYTLENHDGEYSLSKKDNEYRNTQSTVYIDMSLAKRILDYRNELKRFPTLEENFLELMKRDLPIAKGMTTTFFRNTIYDPYSEDGKMTYESQEEYLNKCITAANNNITKLKTEGKSTEIQEYIIDYAKTQLAEIATSIKLKTGLYKTKYNDMELLVVSTEYDISVGMNGYRTNVRDVAQGYLKSQINTLLSEDVKDIKRECIRGTLEIVITEEKNNHGKLIAVYKGVRDKKFTEKIFNVVPEGKIDLNEYSRMKDFK